MKHIFTGGNYPPNGTLLWNSYCLSFQMVPPQHRVPLSQSIWIPTSSNPCFSMGWEAVRFFFFCVLENQKTPEMIWWYSRPLKTFSPLKTKWSFKSDDTKSHLYQFSKSQMNFAEAFFCWNFQNFCSMWFAMVTRDESCPAGVSRSFPMVTRSCLDHFGICETESIYDVFRCIYIMIWL